MKVRRLLPSWQCLSTVAVYTQDINALFGSKQLDQSCTIIIKYLILPIVTVLKKES